MRFSVQLCCTARNFYLDAHLVPDEVTPYMRQNYLLDDALYEYNRDKISIFEGVEVQLQQQSAPKIA